MRRAKPYCVYTDGSYSQTTGKSGFGVYSPDYRNLCLCGPGLNLPNSHRAELYAIEVALGKVISNRWLFDSVIICTDSRVAILRIEEILTTQSGSVPYKGSGLRSIKTLLKLCESYDIDVTMRKVPAHKGIAGNEIADRLAHRAMTDGLSSLKSPLEFENYLCGLFTKFGVRGPALTPVGPPGTEPASQQEELLQQNPSNLWSRMLRETISRMVKLLDKLRSGLMWLIPH